MGEGWQDGVAALADRPVDERRVARVMAALALGLALGSTALAAYLPSTAPSRDAGAQPSSVQARVEARERLHARRRVTLPAALIFVVLTIGPIKRAFGFDRATPLALLLWPALVIGGHLALGHPLTPTPADVTIASGLGALGLGAFLVASALAAVIGRGPPRRRIRRHVATIGWSAAASTLICGGFVGFALGPWSLPPRGAYLPVLFACAGAAALAAVAAVLAASSLRPGPR